MHSLAGLLLPTAQLFKTLASQPCTREYTRVGFMVGPLGFQNTFPLIKRFNNHPRLS